MKLYPTIGLEIHAELLTNSKVFCTCSAEFGGEPNSRCCPVCSGLPGTLPVLNSKAVEYIIKAGYIMNCEILRFTKWDRKILLPRPAQSISDFADAPPRVSGRSR